MGNLGRLGNQMFQYAAVRGISAMRGYEFGIPPFESKRVDNYSLHRAFTLDSVGTRNLAVLDRGHAPVVIEKSFEFDEDCLLYTSPSPRDRTRSRMPSSA